MLKTLTQFFNQHLLIQTDNKPSDTEHALQLSTAALLIEMTRADYQVKDSEIETVKNTIQKHFQLTEHETRELFELASQEADQATTYHEFTSMINEHYSPEQKIRIIELLWEIAWADQEIEKYEDYLVRKIADLLYVPHREFIAAKHRVLENHKTTG